VASPFPAYTLLWFGETALSAQGYAPLMQQLASLIAAKTERPLLDFRLQKRTRKKQAQPQVFPIVLRE
jgi:hypothetical protein